MERVPGSSRDLVSDWVVAAKQKERKKNSQARLSGRRSRSGWFFEVQASKKVEEEVRGEKKERKKREG